MDMRSFDRREFRAATQHHGNWHAADWTSNAADWTPIGRDRRLDNGPHKRPKNSS